MATFVEVSLLRLIDRETILYSIKEVLSAAVDVPAGSVISLRGYANLKLFPTKVGDFSMQGGKNKNPVTNGICRVP